VCCMQPYVTRAAPEDFLNAGASPTLLKVLVGMCLEGASRAAPSAAVAMLSQSMNTIKYPAAMMCSKSSGSSTRRHWCVAYNHSCATKGPTNATSANLLLAVCWKGLPGMC
jgi:hypothetical protein